MYVSIFGSLRYNYLLAACKTLGHLIAKCKDMGCFHYHNFSYLYDTLVAPVIELSTCMWGYKKHKCLEDIQFIFISVSVRTFQLPPLLGIWVGF